MGVTVYPVKSKRFDEILERIIESLPDDVHLLLDEVAIIVEDEPSKELLHDMGIDTGDDPADLCGLHWGVPLTERSVSDPMLHPEQILIFRGPIIRLADGDPEELERQIQITLLHEIGHHFGLDERRLHELGYE